MSLDTRVRDVADQRISAPIALADAGAWPTVIFFIGSLAVLLPFFLFQHLPMVDYPNHLARLYILSAPGDDPLRQMYATAWALIPNLGLDLLYAGLHAWLTPELTIKLAAVLSVSLMVGSVYVIQKEIFGRVSYSVALAPLFVHGLAMQMGYLNYLMGTGLAFAGFALFFAAGRKLTVPLVAALSSLGVVIYLCHVAAFGAYLLLLAALTLHPAIASFRRATIRNAAAPVIAVGLIAAPAALLHAISQKPAAAGGPVYSLVKLRLVIAPTLASAGAVDLAVLIGAIVLLLAMSRLQALRLWRPAGPALAILMVVILALPNKIDKAIDVDSRLVIFLVFFSLAILELWPSTVRRRMVVGVVVVALIAIRVWDLLALGYKYETQVAEFRNAAGHIGPGEKVLIADDKRTASDCSQTPANLPRRWLHAHMGSYLTIDRKAFIPLTFAAPGMQPIRPIGVYASISPPPTVPVPTSFLKEAAHPGTREALARTLAQNDVESYVVDWPEKFDDVVIFHHGCALNPLPGELVESNRGSFFTMYRVLGR